MFGEGCLLFFYPLVPLFFRYFRSVQMANEWVILFGQVLWRIGRFPQLLAVDPGRLPISKCGTAKNLVFGGRVSFQWFLSFRHQGGHSTSEDVGNVVSGFPKVFGEDRVRTDKGGVSGVYGFIAGHSLFSVELSTSMRSGREDAHASLGAPLLVAAG